MHMAEATLPPKKRGERDGEEKAAAAAAAASGRVMAGNVADGLNRVFDSVTSHFPRGFFNGDFFSFFRKYVERIYFYIIQCILF